MTVTDAGKTLRYRAHRLLLPLTCIHFLELLDEKFLGIIRLGK